jgi:hypothetical protein
VRPSANELYNSTDGIVLGVNIEETFYGDFATSRVLADGANIVHPNTGAVVALVREAINDIEIMINSLVVGGVKVSGPFRVAKIGKVDNVRDGAAGSSRTIAFLLIQF